jgi:hypothetical protein
MSSACNNDKVFIGEVTIPKRDISTINIVGVDPIEVRKQTEGELTTFYISYVPYVAPTSNITVTPSIVEVGSTFNATYTATWVKGSGELTSVTIDDIPVSNKNSLSETIVSNGLSTPSEGIFFPKTIKVIDYKGSSSTATTSITSQYRYYVGTKPRFGDNTTIVKDAGKLSSSMSSAYGALKTYSIPELDSHVVWLLPPNKTMGKVTDENNFECETIDGGIVSITNEYGVTVNYTVIQSKNFYASGNTLNLKF